MKQRFIIPGKLPGLNEYTSANRSNAYAGAAMKKKAEKQILAALEQALIRPVKNPCVIRYIWAEPNNRRDQDNVSFSQKFVQDALVQAGILPDDNRNWVTGSSHIITTNKEWPHIEVTIEEAE